MLSCLCLLVRPSKHPIDVDRGRSAVAVTCPQERIFYDVILDRAATRLGTAKDMEKHARDMESFAGALEAVSATERRSIMSKVTSTMGENLFQNYHSARNPPRTLVTGVCWAQRARDAQAAACLVKLAKLQSHY